jgi:hypothetical protein
MIEVDDLSPIHFTIIFKEKDKYTIKLGDNVVGVLEYKGETLLASAWVNVWIPDYNPSLREWSYLIGEIKRQFPILDEQTVFINKWSA